MPEQKQHGRRRKGKSASGDGGSARPSDVVEQPKDASEQAQGQPQEAADQAQAPARQIQGAAGAVEVTTVSGELKKVVREAAIEALTPAARKATTSAAKYAVTKGPGLVSDKVVPRVTDTVMPKVKEAGGPMELARKAGGGAGALLSKIRGGDEDAARSGTGRGRRLPIQESVDVGVPLETAFDQFTQFEDFPEFMHRLERVEQKDDTHLMWHENIWGVRRQWEAEITDQRPNERVAWESTSRSPKQKGVVTFHQLSGRLTRIEVTLDQQPEGLFEKASSGFRMTRRALKSDLMHFKAFIETRDEEAGAWRGRIEEGEVVAGEEAPEDEEEAPENAEAERPSAPDQRTRGRRARSKPKEPDEEEYSEEEAEPEAGYTEEEDEEAEEEEKPKPKRKPARRRPAAPKRKPVQRRSAARRRSPANRSRGR